MAAIQSEDLTPIRLSPERLRRLAVERPRRVNHTPPLNSTITDEAVDRFQDELFDAIRAGRMFWLGEWSEVCNARFLDHVKRYQNLLTHGYINHPFTQTYVLIIGDDNATRIWAVSPNPRNTALIASTLISSYRSEVPDDYVFAINLCCTYDVNKLIIRPTTEHSVELTGLQYLHSPVYEEDGETACQVAAATIFAIGVLATDGIDVSVEEFPAKLNKRRIKRGQPLLPSYFKIKLKSYATAIGGINSRPGEAHGGTHASPIPHLRRGHLRHLGDRTVWVRDCLVNLRKEDMSLARSHYNVHQNAPRS